MGKANQGQQSFSVKHQITVKVFGSVSHKFSVTTTQLYHISQKATISTCATGCGCVPKHYFEEQVVDYSCRLLQMMNLNVHTRRIDNIQNSFYYTTL